MKKISKKIIYYIFIFVLVNTIFNILKFLLDSIKFTYKHTKKLTDMYGNNSWIIITGASSGQGKDYSLEFAKKGFNLLLLGSKGCYDTEKIINTKYPTVKTEVIVKNFCFSYEENFFDDLKLSIMNKDISGFISNIGHRYGIETYYEIEEKKIVDIISAKGITQSKLLKILLPKFLERNKKSFIIIVSALVQNKPSIYDSDNINTLPFLSIYEGINAYSYIQAKTIFEEFKNNPVYKNIDFLNITPAAVITSNTIGPLKNVPFSVKSKYFVKKSIGLLNNYNGITCGCLEHLIASYLPSLLPMKLFKNYIEYNIGKNIAKHYN